MLTADSSDRKAGFVVPNHPDGAERLPYHSGSFRGHGFEYENYFRTRTICHTKLRPEDSPKAAYCQSRKHSDSNLFHSFSGPRPLRCRMAIRDQGEKPRHRGNTGGGLAVRLRCLRRCLVLGGKAQRGIGLKGISEIERFDSRRR